MTIQRATTAIGADKTTLHEVPPQGCPGWYRVQVWPKGAAVRASVRWTIRGDVVEREVDAPFDVVIGADAVQVRAQTLGGSGSATVQVAEVDRAPRGSAATRSDRYTDASRTLPVPAGASSVRLLVATAGVSARVEALRAGVVMFFTEDAFGEALRVSGIDEVRIVDATGPYTVVWTVDF